MLESIHILHVKIPVVFKKRKMNVSKVWGHMKYVTIIFFSPWSTRRFKFSHSDLFFRDGLTQLYLWDGCNSFPPSPPGFAVYMRVHYTSTGK